MFKIKFDPSLERPWCEIFKLIKDHGPKNQPKAVLLGSSLSPPNCNFKKQVCEKCSVQFWRGPWLSCAVLQVIMWKLTDRRHDWWRDTQWDQRLYEITLHPRCSYKHLSLFSLIKRWVLNWGTLTCELFTDPAGLSSSFKRASSRNNHNRHVELSEVTGIVGIPNSEMKNTHSASCC